MLFSLIVAVLVLAIAFFQASHGLFNALIMTVLTICCAAAAIGTYEWVAVTWLMPYWKPQFAAAIALGATFGVPLIILRLMADKAIPRACLLPSWLDRAGGGLCGLVTAEVMVGVMALAVQSIPFHNGNIIGYARVPVHAWEPDNAGNAPKPPPKNEEESELAFGLMPDRFAAAVTAVLSDGVFSGQRGFLQDYPDLVQAIGWRSAAPSAAKPCAAPNSIQFVRTEPVQMVYKLIPPSGAAARGEQQPPTYEPLPPTPGMELHMIRVKLTPDAKARGDLSHVFTLRQFRLVGQAPGSDHNGQYYPIAIQQVEDTEPNRHVRVEQNRRFGDWPVSEVGYEPRPGSGNEVEVVFELPPGFEPEFIEYKHFARAAVSFGPDRASTAYGRPAPIGQTVASRSAPDRGDQGSANRGTRSASSEPASRGGAVRGVAARVGKSHFGDALPLALTSYRGLKNAETKGAVLVDGHLVAELDRQDGGTDAKVDRLHVPEGKRLLHLNVQHLSARSGLGRIISGAVKTVQNYFVEDEAGSRYELIGQYAFADVGGERIFEVQYFSSPVGKMGGLGKFDKIKDADLKKDGADLVLLFAVDPGAKIVSFSTGGAATRKDDLRDENLVAPD